MEPKLNGTYRISFDIEAEISDNLSLSDVAQAITEGFGEDLIGKVSHLNLEKIEKTGEIEIPKVFKVGDVVQFTDNITIEADLYSDDGYVFAGIPTEISEKVTETPANIEIEAGSRGFVNKINKDGSIEIVNIDKPYINPLWTEIGLNDINLDLITVKAEAIENVTGEER